MTMPGKRDRKPDGRFEIGDLILGRYKVLSELGQGGMGVVYKCFDETAGIELALKAIPPELSHNTMEMEDVKENFQLVSRLVHQNIAISKNLEKDNATGNYYLIMECVEGEDLRHWIKWKRKEGPLTLEIILPVIRQVADALDYAHKQKIIHRDIKPGNIMIDAEGNVKVLDFGLAAQIHTSMTRVSMAYHGTSGTAPYMAPEQWRGKAQGAAADQYALAVMTYEMLAGHLPFEGTDASVLREAVLNGTADTLQGIPVCAQQALARGMSKKPEDRFNSCSDFAAALGGKSVSGGTAKVETTGRAAFTETTQDRDTIVKRISVLMEQQDWSKAREYCGRLLDSEPENPELYLMMCMIEHKTASESLLAECGCKLDEDKNFIIAVKFASEERKQKLLVIQKAALLNFHLSKCMSERRISKLNDLSLSSNPLFNDKNFLLAMSIASEEEKKTLLRIQYDQAEHMLAQFKAKNRIQELIQTPFPLESDKTFQTAMKSASSERRKELLQIQQDQGEYFLRKCMEANHVSTESELAGGDSPLHEDPYFRIALLCSAPERKQELQKLQNEQVAHFVRKCMEANHISAESELSRCSTPLKEDHYFALALKYASPEQKKGFVQIQFDQSDYYLKRCMENNNISDASNLYRAKKNLTKDQDFYMAQKCATPEQLKTLDLILGKNILICSKRFVVHVVTLLGIVLGAIVALIIIIGIIVSSGS